MLHWQPDIKTNRMGEANLSFYNGDQTGTTKIIVEVISKDGEIGYKEFIYEVEP